jgi:hypothetical protein
VPQPAAMVGGTPRRAWPRYQGTRHTECRLLGAERKGIGGGDIGGGDSGGAEGDRTPDLVNAIHALSQLSYGPSVMGNWRAASAAGPPKYSAMGFRASGRELGMQVGAVLRQTLPTRRACPLADAETARRLRPRAYCGSSGSATGPPIMLDMSEPSSSSSSRKVSSSSLAAGSSSPSTTASSSPSASGTSSGLIPATS